MVDDVRQPFPKRTDSQATGELGVSIVSLKVRNELGWEFRRTPQESDFGIDGYIDLVTANGHVTGKSIAVQIKTGASYLMPESGESHWRYGGSLKHLNYYSNQACPVLLLLVDPDNYQVWWRKFVAYETEKTISGWTTDIPKVNRLNAESRQPLEFIAGKAEDYLAHMDEVWTIGEKAKDRDIIFIRISRKEVEISIISPFLKAVRRLISNRENALGSMSKLDFIIDGYDDDPREVYEIPEIRNWIQCITSDFRQFSFLLRLHDLEQGINVISTCLGNARKVDDMTVEIRDIPALLGFMEDQVAGLNELTDNLGIDQVNRIAFMRFAKKIYQILQMPWSGAEV